jgi:hypothetical protein
VEPPTGLNPALAGQPIWDGRARFGPSLNTAYSTVSVLHTRLRRSVASSFVVSFSPRSDRSRDRSPSRDARVFRPCSREPGSSCGLESLVRFQRPLTPCAHRLGEQTRSQSLGRVMSPGCLTREPPGLPCLVRQTRGFVPASRVSARKREPPRAFHGFDELDHGPNRNLPDTITGGLTPALRPSLTRAPFPRREKSMTSSRVNGLLHRCTPDPRWALRLASNPSSRCLDSVSTTDVARHEHPLKHPLWRPSAGDRGETRQPSTSQIALGLAALPPEPRTTPDHLAVIRPPAAARLTARCRLRADRLSPCCLAARVRGERRCLVSWRRLCRIGTLWHLSRRSHRRMPKHPFPDRVDPFPPEHVNAPDLPEPEMPSTREVPASPLSSAPEALCLAGRREQPPRVFIDVREHRLDLSSHAFAWEIEAARAPPGFCRTMFPRARLGTARTPSPPCLR